MDRRLARWAEESPKRQSVKHCQSRRSSGWEVGSGDDRAGRMEVALYALVSSAAAVECDSSRLVATSHCSCSYEPHKQARDKKTEEGVRLRRGVLLIGCGGVTMLVTVLLSGPSPPSSRGINGKDRGRLWWEELEVRTRCVFRRWLGADARSCRQVLSKQFGSLPGFGKSNGSGNGNKVWVRSQPVVETETETLSRKIVGTKTSLPERMFGNGSPPSQRRQMQNWEWQMTRNNGGLNLFGSGPDAGLWRWC
ncbi:hypothetical protein B0T17DRAFT_511255 [Bombardia bombarda]|uniref:Uncharacterized protein n=1 Tax=Bombardia bombarda TaxID=252184 RepID=A0AA39U7N9_9PEZI|nr:hypothetical protein B0T17DRAFT_511255 [Bombardia bombarda]